MNILRIISLAFAVTLAIFTIIKFKKGSMLNFPSVLPDFKINYSRLENPVRFWMATISQIFLIILLLIFGLGMM